MPFRTWIRHDWHKAYLDWRFGKIDLGAKLGRRGEMAAARYLRQRGYTILAEGESDRGGELDLIALHRKSGKIVFVEVKTSASTKPGNPAERVTLDKQLRVARASLRYLKRKGLLGAACRFDVIAVWWPPSADTPTRIEHYEAAFENPLEFQMF
ncbi:MAG: YraN family protein [Planctomycetota bacterium]